MATHDQSPFDTLEHASPDELRARLHSLAVLLARAPVPIAVAHDPECRVVSANPALIRLLGVPEGANVSLTPPPGHPAPYRIRRQGRELPPEELPMQYAIAHRTSVRNEIEIERPDGTIVYVQNDVEPLYDESGAVTGCVSVCVDLTERKLASDHLHETHRRKDEFLATLSHELRNPLAPIRNAVELMCMAPDDEEIRRQALTTLQRQLLQLVRLTDDLLDVSRITRGRVELRRERIDLRTIIQGAVESAQPHIDAAEHTLVLTLPSEPVWLDADFTRLAQAFANVLNNAAKYTDRGGRISITASTERGTAIVRMSDTGIGLDPAFLPHVFEMFSQADQAVDRTRGGLGIGLALAQTLIGMHGGTIEAASEGRNRGTTFTVRLPAAPAPTEEEAAAPHPRAARPRRILIAEDSRDAAEMLRIMLEYSGHDVRVVFDGVDAVTQAASFRPQVALLDIGMPRMDGYEAARRIRSTLGTSVVLVALTGWGQDEDKERARDAGFDHHLTKPADPDKLQQLIYRLAGE